MKKLVLLLIAAVSFTASAQSFSVKNVNEDYVVAGLKDYDPSKTDLRKIIKDKRGLYWFQGLTEISSFDGVNWKHYKLKSVSEKTAPFRINDIELSPEGIPWLATEDGIYIYKQSVEDFVSVRQIFPGMKAFPLAVSIFYQIPGCLLFSSQHNEGFYLFEWKTRKLVHIIIDGISKALIPGDNPAPLAADNSGNVWGLTADNKGIWNYNSLTGKVRCAWKGELPQFGDKRFRDLSGLTHSDHENVLWISHGSHGYLEKMWLETGKSNFYSFSGNLRVQADSNAVNKYKVLGVRIDRAHNTWVRVGEKYIVKLDDDAGRMEYLVDDPNGFSLGDMRWFRTEAGTGNNKNDNNILLWIAGKEKLSTIKKRSPTVSHIPFDTLTTTGVQPIDYDNSDGRHNIFFENGSSNEYYLLQQNPRRPKLICLDKNFKIKKALFNDEWKEYPAYFNPSIDTDTFYIALMRPGIEQLDFRNVVLKDFKVDLRNFKVQELKLDLRQRVWRYGAADANKVCWLFSNGYLYSYDPQKDIFDSIFICKPGVKGSYRLELIKGFDYPTVLHKESSTFWIDFIPAKELYKINLRTRKVDSIIKCCMDQKNCVIPGGVYEMYAFDQNRIYIQLNFSAMLLNVYDNSLTDYFDIFKNKPEVQNPVGSGMYKNRLCYVLPSHIYFHNTVSGIESKLTLNEDFRWPITQFNSPPLVNDRGEMVLMSVNQKGFLVFNVDSIRTPERPGDVILSYIKVDNRSLPLDSLGNRSLTLNYNGYDAIQLGFSDYSFYDPEKIGYEYAMYKRGDTAWNKIIGRPELTFRDLSAGKYRLLLRASNPFGEYSEEISSFTIIITPPFWQTWWFRALVLVALGLIAYGVYRYRIRQVVKLQTIRNNIASDLHDDIGSTLNSISIYSEVAKQQAGRDIPALDLIGLNSRKIIENMSDIVWTINPENDSFEKIIVRMRSFVFQLLKAKKIEYTFEADEKLNSITLPMQVRKNFYLVFKEAITNLVKYSAASKVSISLYEENKMIILKIKDNGIGIPENPETQGNGLMNMKRRAEEIHASLNIRSANGNGTEIELLLKS